MLKILIPLTVISLSLLADKYHVLRAVDGDTIMVSKNKQIMSVRLAGIDTPESYASSKLKRDVNKCNVQPYIMIHLGLSAKEYMQDNLTGKDIDIKIIGLGKYYRKIGYIPNITEDLVAKGYATVKNFHNLPKNVIKHLKDLQEDAMSKQIGMWRYLKTDCMNKKTRR